MCSENCPVKIVHIYASMIGFSLFYIVYRLDDYCSVHATEATDVRKHLEREDSLVKRMQAEFKEAGDAPPQKLVEIADDLKVSINFLV